MKETRPENYPYLSYELSKLAKQAGFDEPCTAVYEENALSEGGEVIFMPSSTEWTVDKLQKGIDWLERYKRPGLFNTETKNSTIPQFLTTAPTYQQIVDWLREEKGYHITIDYEQQQGIDHYIVTSKIGYMDGDEYYSPLDSMLYMLLIYLNPIKDEGTED